MEHGVQHHEVIQVVEHQMDVGHLHVDLYLIHDHVQHIVHHQ